MTPDPDSIREILQATATAEILPRFRRCEDGGMSASPTAHKADGSLVTETDRAVQARIAAAIARRHPTTPLLGEEMQRAQQDRLLAAGEHGVWILDPLDGTSNYALGFPGFAISIAYLEHGASRFGMILDPVRQECFHAIRGEGAFLNGVTIRPVATSDQLSDGLAMVDLKRLPPSRIPRLFRPGGFRSQRNLGSVALDWCWLAAGRFQLYLHGGQRLWDYAAGRLIASEAGAASALYAGDGITQDDAISLEPRLAVAAANEGLLKTWLDFIELPFEDAA
ncbi:inositol monophosphatase [Thiocapsa imhoffii]|uniref:Inositol monophosphatase n=1 Tax=Thiocapsa imhoffii TaxID=382777 RepID=A0A9X0WG64_9GAMM|nr:inositol monophosphatase [Thiocapsa imhoffii]MBK1644052.1 inositol monophosphatase [Thiocapsa imhoffii]